MKPIAAWLWLALLVSGQLCAENWPRFRGATGQGISGETRLPLHWHATSNITWKTEIAGQGWSSPIVWQDRIFVTTATQNGAECHVLCLGRDSGQILWDKHVFDQVPRRKEGKNSFATPTPVTDGQRVYAVFGDGSVAALTLDGSLVWTNREVLHYSRHGLGASPLLQVGPRHAEALLDRGLAQTTAPEAGDTARTASAAQAGLLIMAYDGSNPVTAAGSWPNNTPEERLGWQIPWDKAQVVAMDSRTGKRVWTGKRGLSRIAHVSPIEFTENGRSLILSCAGDAIQAFDPKDGALVWHVYSQGEGVTPSPVLGEGLIFTSSGFEKTTLRAVRPGGRGDVTQTHIAWEQKKGVPTQASLLHVKPYLYGITDGGIAHCYQAHSGDIVWQERVGGNFCASPVYADGRIYFLNEAGETTVIATGPEFKILARNPLQEKCQASMAISDAQLFIRGERHLFCIGKRLSAASTGLPRE